MQHYVLVFVLSGWWSQGRSVNNDDSKIWLRQFTDDRNALCQWKTQYISVNLMMMGKKNLSKNDGWKITNHVMTWGGHVDIG